MNSSNLVDRINDQLAEITYKVSKLDPANPRDLEAMEEIGEILKKEESAYGEFLDRQMGYPLNQLENL